MNSRKVIALFISAVLLLTMILSGCGGSSGNEANGQSTAGTSAQGQSDQGQKEKSKITITYWGGGVNSADPIDQAFNKATEEFNANNTVNATAELQYIAGTTYYTKLPAMIAANAAPDLFGIHAAGKLKTYVDAGKVEPLNDYLSNDETWKNSFSDGVFKLLSWNDKTYAIPWYSSAVALFYNKEIFDKYSLQPPETYEDLKNVISVLNKNNVTPFAFGAKEAWTCALFMEVLANRIGGDKPFDDIMNGGGDWTDPSFVKAGQVMQELVSLKAFPSDFLGVGETAMAAMFKNGEAGMYVMGSWAVSQVHADDSKVKDKVGVAKFPSISGGAGDPDVWLGQTSINLAVSATSKNKEAAVAYLKEWTSDKWQKHIGEVCGQTPATNVQLDASKVPALSLEVNKLLGSSKGMFIFYDVGLGAKIGDEFNNTVQAICGGKDPTESLKKLQEFTKSNRE